MVPISIALVRQRYAGDGGAERFVARLLEAFQGQDVKITLITREWQAGAGFEVLTVNPFYLGRLWRDWSFARAVRKLLTHQYFDLVQSHERIAGCHVYRAGDGVHCHWLAQRARILPWWRRLLQAINPYHLYVQHAEREMFRSPRLRAVICNSAMVKHEIRRYFGVAEDVLHVIYNGVNLDDFNPRHRAQRAETRARYGIPDEAPLCLFVGSGFERKGVAALLRATALLPTNIHVMIVGRDKHLSRYRRIATALRIDQRVVFTGSQADVRPFYGAADLFVLPTLYDPFPNAVLEALASGLPVLTSTSCGAAEVIENGREGYVCDALDVARMASIIQKHDWSPDAGVAARERATAFSIDSMRRQLQWLYQGLVDAGKQPARR